jgi:hypothetical protein
VGDVRIGVERGRERGGILVDLHDVAAAGTEDLQEPVAAIGFRELALLDVWRQGRRVRQEPELEEPHRFGRRAVPFRVQRPGPQRHPLHAAGQQRATVPERVGMRERPLDDVRDALDVGVRMHRPVGSRREPVVVEHAERPDAHLRGIPVPIEREVPASLEPTAVLGMDLRVASDLEHAGP